MNFLVSTAKKGKGKRKFLLSQSTVFPFKYHWTYQLTKAARFDDFELALLYARSAYKSIVVIESKSGVFPVCSVTLNVRDLFAQEILADLS